MPAPPKVTLVGKGVAFDTGGLDIKPTAAHAADEEGHGRRGRGDRRRAHGHVRDLPVRLRVLVPAVENAISGPAFRPGDVLTSRKGLTSRSATPTPKAASILADALALADEEAPELLVDFATLTGAARVALGPDLPPFYTDDEALAADLARLGRAVNDPVWRLPLWPPYDSAARFEDRRLNHVSGGAIAGSITAALFLHRFVERAGLGALRHLRLELVGQARAVRRAASAGGAPGLCAGQGALIRARIRPDRAMQPDCAGRSAAEE